MNEHDEDACPDCWGTGNYHERHEGSDPTEHKNIPCAYCHGTGREQGQ